MNAFARSIGVIFLSLVLVAPAVAKQSQGGRSVGHGTSAPVAAAKNSVVVHGGGARGRELRNPPPADPARKVNVQDCTKPIDLEAGNLKCR